MANTAKSMIDKGRSQLGYREGNNNYTKYPPEVPGLAWAQNEPWCQTWISWLAVKTGNTDVIPLTASCLTCTNYYKQRNRFHRSGPKPGDLVMYGASGGTHVDMVTEVSGSRIRVIGGNTGGSYNGQYFNGDGVYEKWTDISNPRIHGFARPAYKAGGGGGGGETSVLPETGGQKPPAKGKFTVKKGMTLLGICALLGVTLGELLTANPEIKDPNKIREGQEINIPAKKETAKPDPVKPDPTKKPDKEKPVVSKPEPSGKPDPSTDGSGKPVVPTKPGTEKPNPSVKPDKDKPVTSGTTTYTVQKGDTLWDIARKHKVSLSALLAANAGRFGNPDLIFPGQTVLLPGHGSTNDKTSVHKPGCNCTCDHTVQTKPSKPVSPNQKPDTGKETSKPPVTPPTTGAGVSVESLLPQRTQGVQKNWDRPLNAAELENARIIREEAIKAFGPGAQRGERAAVVGIATAYQESRLQNLKGGDRDSAGLFQQRPSMGWGSFAQVTDPHYAAAKFFSTMKEKFGSSNFSYLTTVSLVELSHRVQLSGSPSLPGHFELSAARLVAQLAGGQGKHASEYDPAKDTPKQAEKGTSNQEEPKKDEAVTTPPQQPSSWVKPVQAAKGTPFGQKGSMWSSGAHTGLDFPAPQGTPVTAARAGKVESAGWNGAYGMSVVIDHGEGIKTRYAHLSATNVGVGQAVSGGANIGNVGSTGNTTGPHLHFEVLANGAQVDPARFIG
ncbi:peptidoglycan DD-metalloendopeptidase family protein [Streptomyces griseofuscus]|uniref:peptidoglycan DD-metalloendopeptidase family protein n=1 Tax=Streptomyces griseofuscus TaxID=146922 RepID=UPI00367D442B